MARTKGSKNRSPKKQHQVVRYKKVKDVDAAIEAGTKELAAMRESIAKLENEVIEKRALLKEKKAKAYAASHRIERLKITREKLAEADIMKAKKSEIEDTVMELMDQGVSPNDILTAINSILE